MSGWVDGLVLLVFFIIAYYYCYKYGDEIVFDWRSDERKEKDEAFQRIMIKMGIPCDKYGRLFFR